MGTTDATLAQLGGADEHLHGADMEPVRINSAQFLATATPPPDQQAQPIPAVAPGGDLSDGAPALAISNASRAVSDYIPIRQREKFRLELYAQDCLCFWCRTEMDIVNRERITPKGRIKANDWFASFEHLVPQSMGGRFTRTNIRLAHAGCNRKRFQKRHLPRYAHDPLNQGAGHDRRPDRLQQRGHAAQDPQRVPGPTAAHSPSCDRSHNPERETVVR